MADIYVSTLDRKEVYQFPTLPEESPTVSQVSKNEEFPTFNNGNYNLLNGTELITFSLSQMLPEQQYEFCKASYTNSDKIISLFANSLTNTMPIKFIFRGKSETSIINLTVTVEKLEWHFDKALDIIFTADFKQYVAIV